MIVGVASNDRVRHSYSELSAQYVDVAGSIARTHPDDRELVSTWAHGLSGRVLDAGSGPGQWTDFLAKHHLEVRGIDLVPEFVTHARAEYPDLRFDVGSFERIDERAGALGGILSWYTTIHHQPEDLPAVFAEFARVIAPGGGLLIGFFEWPVLEPFGHLVTEAFRWPVSAMCELIEGAGLETVQTHTRTEAGVRPHGAIVARKPTT